MATETGNTKVSPSRAIKKKQEVQQQTTKAEAPKNSIKNNATSAIDRAARQLGLRSFSGLTYGGPPKKGSSWGPTSRNKKTNKLHRSRMLRRKHARTKKNSR